MGGLENIFDVIGSHPYAKWLALAFALRALWTLIVWRRCELLRRAAAAGAGDGSRTETLEVIERRRQEPWRHSARFLAVMVAGLGAAIYGLFKMAGAGEAAPHALVLLMGGMYLFLTEPIRHQITDAEDRLAAATRRGDPEATALARAMLNGNHVNLVLIDMGAAVGLGIAILALSGGMPMPLRY